MRFEETVHFIAGSNAQQAASLGHRQLPGANPFEGKSLKGCPGQLVRIGGEPASQILRYFESHMHRAHGTIMATVTLKVSGINSGCEVFQSIGAKGQIANVTIP